jgi:hypothetical protein
MTVTGAKLGVEQLVRLGSALARRLVPECYGLMDSERIDQ